MTSSPDNKIPVLGRVLVLGERWLGSNARAVTAALRRKGWNVTDFAQREYVPLKWQSRPMKIAGRLFRAGAAYELNRAILLAARQNRPEVFLAFKGTYVFASTLEQLKRLGIRTYCVYPDVSFRAHGPYIPRALPRYDWVFTTKTFGIDDMREQLGMTRTSFILHASDPDLHRPVPLTTRDREDFGCDASFIGTWSPKKERILAEVIQKVPELKLRVFGSQWDRVGTESPLKPYLALHPVYTLDYVKAILAAKINIAILSEARIGASAGDQITSRTFHIPASGGFTLHERTHEVRSVFEEGRHIACFADADELAAKIRYYLDHEEERVEMAAAGHEEAAAKHTWDQRISVVLTKHAELVGHV